LAGAWALLELGLRLSNSQIWAALPHCEPISPALLSDRLHAAAQQRQGKKLCLAIGDSVFFGGAMREKGIPAWSQKTPVSYLRQKLGSGWVVLDLSADGLEAMDMWALLHAARPLSPDAVVVELNLRMLAADASQWPGCMSRPWLGAWLPKDCPIPAPQPASGFEKEAFERMHGALTDSSVVARYAELARALLFQPSARDRCAAGVKAMMPGDAELDPDDLLDMKIRPYYDSPGAGPGHFGRRALEGMAAEIKGMHVAGLVFLTPQNFRRVAGFLDQSGLTLNRNSLARAFHSKEIPYRDLSQAMPEGHFLDHCHLDPQGNWELAQRLCQGWQP
jgi:hypothetical protein